MATLALSLLSSTPTTITIGWTPVAGAAGYVYLVDGKRIANTWDAAVKQTTFGIPSSGHHTYEVQAVAVAADGSLAYPTPPPPSGFAQLPVGPFTSHSSPVTFGNASPQTVSKLSIENIKGQIDGLKIMQWPPVLSPSPWTVTDILTQNIGNVPPTSDGTQEAGIWIGQSANCDRLVCDGSWEGLWTGAMCCDCTIQNFTVGKADNQGGYQNPAGGVAGLYCEHFTRRVVFQNFEIHSIGSKGIISEWWYADSTYAPFVAKEYPTAMAGKAGSCHNTYTKGRIYCPAGGYGIFFDAGTWGNTTSHITFWGPGAAYAAPKNLAGPIDNVIDEASCTFLQSGPNVTLHNNKIG